MSSEIRSSSPFSNIGLAVPDSFSFADRRNAQVLIQIAKPEFATRALSLFDAAQSAKSEALKNAKRWNKYSIAEAEAARIEKMSLASSAEVEILTSMQRPQVMTPPIAAAGESRTSSDDDIQMKPAVEETVKDQHQTPERVEKSEKAPAPKPPRKRPREDYAWFSRVTPGVKKTQSAFKKRKLEHPTEQPAAQEAQPEPQTSSRSTYSQPSIIRPRRHQKPEVSRIASAIAATARKGTVTFSTLKKLPEGSARAASSFVLTQSALKKDIENLEGRIAYLKKIKSGEKEPKPSEIILYGLKRENAGDVIRNLQVKLANKRDALEKIQQQIAKASEFAGNKIKLAAVFI